MINKNKHQADGIDIITPSQNNLLNYRNAIYQGHINTQTNQREGSGILYIPNNNKFIACNSFSQNNLDGMSLFYHSHSKFCYGLWRNNMPQSINIFRIQQILIIGQYDKGFMRTGSIIIFIFQKYNLGIALEITDDNSYVIKQKKQITTNNHIIQFLEQCNFNINKNDQLHFSLIKFINKQFLPYNNENNDIKLRLINNKYYRFGYDKGLAIMFDDQYKIISMGYHIKNNLSGVGIKYYSEELGNKIEQGIFDDGGENTYLYDRKQSRPQERINQLYSRMHLASLNFVNQHYKDPSQGYFKQFQHLLETQFFKEVFYNVILNNSNDSFRKMMESEKIHEQSFRYYERIHLKQHQIPKNQPYEDSMLQRSSVRQELKQSQSQKGLNNLNMSKISKRSNNNDSRDIDVIKSNSKQTGYIVVKKQFQDLTQRNRLQILKKQLYENINTKRFPAKLQSSPYRQRKKTVEENQFRYNKIINKEQASRRNLPSVQRKRSNIYIQDNKNVQEQKDQVQKIPNLDRNMNIVIRQQTPQQRSESISKFNQTSKSKSKRKIFGQNSIKRDYTPQRPSSPFKHRMKSRIFAEHTPSRSRSKSRSNRKIFTNNQSKAIQSPIKQDYKMRLQKSITSPHQNLNLSFKSINDSNSKADHYQMPITINDQTTKKYSKISRQMDSIGEQQINNKPKNSSKLAPYYKQNYKFHHQDNNKSNLQKSFKRSNMIYINQQEPQQYRQKHTYQPIAIKQSGNSPYLKSQINNASKSIKKSSIQPLQCTKKHISQTSPLRQKMQKYVNPYQQVENKQRQNSRLKYIANNMIQQGYSNYKKRTSYF